MGSKPLFGAQQIPGDDPTLRVAEVSFPREHYARCEIVKVSSVLDMVDAITKEFIGLGYLSENLQGERNYSSHQNIEEQHLNNRAQQIAKIRSYPTSLACRTVSDAK